MRCAHVHGAHDMVQFRADRTEFEERLSHLTRREREVMDLLVEGLPNKVIAAKLRLARKTIETHRSNLMTKMKASSLADLIRHMLTYRGLRP
jgi:FixJ family two-component response regulator